MQFLKQESRQEDVLTSGKHYAVYCLVYQKIISFRQFVEDSFRLKCRADSWGKEEQRSVLHLASHFQFVCLTTLVSLLLFSLQKDTEVAPTIFGMHYTISIGRSSTPVSAPWMIPDLRDSANLHHGETLWTAWEDSRYTCNFTGVLCLIGALVHNDSEFSHSFSDLFPEGLTQLSILNTF